MTYLVTGGAGFIGANYIKYLLKIYGKNVSIIILDALTYAGNLLTIKNELNLENVKFIKGDIGDRDLVTQILAENEIDFIVNFAAGLVQIMVLPGQFFLGKPEVQRRLEAEEIDKIIEAVNRMERSETVQLFFE